MVLPSAHPLRPQQGSYAHPLRPPFYLLPEVLPPLLSSHRVGLETWTPSRVPPWGSYAHPLRPPPTPSG
jgi:hypothetical protein